MTHAIAAITKGLLNLVYPLRCAACGRALESANDEGVCADCLEKIRPAPESYPAEKSRHFEAVASACLYEGTLKELIHAFKYKARRGLARPLAGILTSFLKDNPEILDRADIVTFVPLRPARLRARGFNQSRLLAESVSQVFNIPLKDVLDKIRETRPQNELARKERLENLKEAFRPRGDARIEGASLLLVDDVMTTGATLDECARTLKRAGASKVRGLTLARGI